MHKSIKIYQPKQKHYKFLDIMTFIRSFMVLSTILSDNTAINHSFHLRNAMQPTIHLQAFIIA